MNITDEQGTKIPNGKDKKYIKETLKSEFGEEVTYNATENTIYVLNNIHMVNWVLVKLLSEYKCYLQTSLF